MRVSAAYLERVAREWQAAYVEAHDKSAPAIVWERGWFRIFNDSRWRPRYRRATIEAMTKTLRKSFSHD
jgi:hypothetical protein